MIPGEANKCLFPSLSIGLGLGLVRAKTKFKKVTPRRAPNKRRKIKYDVNVFFPTNQKAHATYWMHAMTRWWVCTCTPDTFCEARHVYLLAWRALYERAINLSKPFRGGALLSELLARGEVVWLTILKIHRPKQTYIHTYMMPYIKRFSRRDQNRHHHHLYARLMLR